MRLGLLLVVVVVSSFPAHAYTVKNTSRGVGVHWAERTVDFVVSGAGDKKKDHRLPDATTKAAANWSATGEVRIAVFGPDKVAPVGYVDGEGTLNVSAWSGKVWDEDEDMLAVTYLHYKTDTGEILDADIVVNDTDFLWTDADEAPVPNAYDLTNTLTHEMGHALGLGHSEVGSATMFWTSYAMETSKRDLDADDVSAIHSLYAKVPQIADPDVALVDPAAPAGCQSTSGDAPGMALSLAAIAWLSDHRRRKIAG